LGIEPNKPMRPDCLANSFRTLRPTSVRTPTTR
jgi:hypothetical protein